MRCVICDYCPDVDPGNIPVFLDDKNEPICQVCHDAICDANSEFEQTEGEFERIAEDA